MRLNAQIEYASKALYELTLENDKQQSVCLQDIAARHKISDKFLLQIMLRLKSAGIVKSRRGVNGGYLLAKSPKDICFADVVRAVDSSLLTKSVQTHDSEGRIDHVLSTMWDEMNQQMEGYLSRIDLVTFVEKTLAFHPFVYTI